MAHATTASASSHTHVNVDARLKNLKKNVLPDYPLRLTQVNDHADARRPAGNCKYCGQNKDNCFCYAHHTFLSREEMTTYSDKTSAFDQGPSSSKLSSSQHTPASAPQSHSAAAAAAAASSRSGKKMSLGEYSKRMQEGGPGAGRSTPKDAPSPAEPTISRDTPSAKSKAQQSTSLSVNDSSGGHPDGDRPAKKLKTSSSTSIPVQNASVSRLAANNISASSKHVPLSRSPSKKSSTSEENAASTDRKHSVVRTHASKRDASSSRPKSPSASSKSDYSRNRRSPSPIERPREKLSKKDDRDHKSKSERNHSKDHDRMGPLLPKMLSPLPDELNRLVDEYERKHPELVKYRDVDSLSMDDEPPRKLKKADKSTDKSSSHPESRTGNKADGDSRPSKSEYKLDRLDPGGRDNDGRVQLQGQSPRQGFKVPAKRPPADAVAKSREPERDRLIVRLHYGSRNAGKVKKILKSEPKSASSRDDNHPAESQSERTISRDRSPHLPTRVSITTLKATSSVKANSNGKIATPNRRMASSSERPKSSEQGPSSRLSTSQSNDREPDELGDNDMLRADSEAFLALGIKLKHKADEALGVKNPEEANLHHALVYACHCVIAYFLSFGLDDELRRRENRSSTSESWRSVVGYIKFLLSSRLKANPAIHGLLYQMGAICSERVSSFEQERLLGISLSDSAQSDDGNTRNVLENVRRSRNDLVRILRTNHEWWNLGHQRLPWASVQAEFQRTWSRRSPQVVRRPQITPGHYLTPFYLPLYSGSTAFEAATFAWMVTQEWATQARLNLDTGLHLTWSNRDDRDVAKRVADQSKSVLRDMGYQFRPLGFGSMINAALQDATAVTMGSHCDTVLADSIENELATWISIGFLCVQSLLETYLSVFWLQPVQTFLNNMIAIQVLYKLHNFTAEGIDNGLYLSQCDFNKVRGRIVDELSALPIISVLEQFLAEILRKPDLNKEFTCHQLDNKCLRLTKYHFHVFGILFFQFPLKKPTPMLVFAKEIYLTP
ncbi:hypothetical protein Dda_2957 [Drechslerella dactyloides]|uniref:Ell binding protein Ebp1 C-terminal domain-containing protein n=1 Tax=Drechslerella dactyloides TaxID=74499 RepID=A0AAD6J4W6_DREDA|nr:hypothetical protein Dda_2957 [Drechslerella dactyloides]